jgi:hypothetical protein
VVGYISSRQKLLEFVKLWALVKNVNLRCDEQDSISWKWTSNGEYSVGWAYKIQFQGSHPPFHMGNLWKARIESKVKLFDWMVMHQKIPTAKTLASRGMQVNSACTLCNSRDKNAQHLLTDCSFSREVLHLIWAWYNLSGGPSQGALTPGTAAWLTSNVASANAQDQRGATGIILYCWWNVWKERNRRVFKSDHKIAYQVALLAKEEIDSYKMAFRTDLS